MAVKQKKRRWSAEEKISFCLQTTTPGVSVAQVARRYALNANLIFKWLRDDRYACSLDAVPKPDSPVFLPIEVEGPARPAPVLPVTQVGRIEIELPGGCRITAEGGFDADVLARLLRGLSS